MQSWTMLCKARLVKLYRLPIQNHFVQGSVVVSSHFEVRDEAQNSRIRFLKKDQIDILRTFYDLS
jgi:hypothetical protein